MERQWEQGSANEADVRRVWGVRPGRQNQTGNIQTKNTKTLRLLQDKIVDGFPVYKLKMYVMKIGALYGTGHIWLQHR